MGKAVCGSKACLRSDAQLAVRLQGHVSFSTPRFSIPPSPSIVTQWNLTISVFKACSSTLRMRCGRSHEDMLSRGYQAYMYVYYIYTYTYLLFNLFIYIYIYILYVYIYIENFCGGMPSARTWSREAANPCQLNKTRFLGPPFITADLRTSLRRAFDSRSIQSLPT